jgi:hypothetical protein
MRRRLIVNIEDEDITDQFAMSMVKSVVTMGKISNDGKSYCYATTFGHGEYAVEAISRANGETFYVRKITEESE